MARVQELITLRSLYVEKALQQEVEAPATPRKTRAEGQLEVVRYGKPPSSTDQSCSLKRTGSEIRGATRECRR